MTQKQPTAGVVLAAGMSTRMGKSKLLMDLGGTILLARVVEAALASELEKLILVLGHEAEKVKASLDALIPNQRLSIVVNERYREGMASSLQAGLREVQAKYSSVMFLLGDQPFVDTAAINLLLHRFWESDKDICVPMQGNSRGNPVTFTCRFYDGIFGIRGDRGAREIVRNHPDNVLFVEIDDPLCFMDIDDAEDAEKLLSLLTSTPKRPRPFP